MDQKYGITRLNRGMSKNGFNAPVVIDGLRSQQNIRNEQY